MKPVSMTSGLKWKGEAQEVKQGSQCQSLYRLPEVPYIPAPLPH